MENGPVRRGPRPGPGRGRRRVTLYENGRVRPTLTTRTIALGAVVAVLVAAAFVVVASSAREARRTSDAAQRAQAVTVSAVALSELTSRLDSALRGYVLGNQPHFLTPFEAARGALPGARRALAAAATGGDERSALSAAGGELDAYLRDFAPRAIRAGHTEPSPAEEVALDNESTARSDSSTPTGNRWSRTRPCAWCASATATPRWPARAPRATGQSCATRCSRRARIASSCATPRPCTTSRGRRSAGSSCCAT